MFAYCSRECRLGKSPFPELAYSPAHVRRITSEGKFAAYLLPQTSDRSSPATFFEVFSIAYTDSGRLLPLKAIGAGIDFIHIFRIVVVAKNKVGLAQADSENQSAGIMKLMSVGFKIR